MPKSSNARPIFAQRASNRRSVNDNPGKSDDSTHTAEYIASMTRSLSAIAGQAGLQTLCYLLDMARLEAESLAQQKQAPGQSGQTRDTSPPA